MLASSQKHGYLANRQPEKFWEVKKQHWTRQDVFYGEDHSPQLIFLRPNKCSSCMAAASFKIVTGERNTIRSVFEQRGETMVDNMTQAEPLASCKNAGTEKRPFKD
jgi:hypothetical protein